MVQAKPVRRYDLDWLRIIATFLLFPFHVGKVFDVPPFFHIKNAQLSANMELLTGFIYIFHMPLFFFLAGWAIHASLKSRKTSEFVKERLTRLFIPFLAGTALMGPIMKYIELNVIGPEGFSMSFLKFLPKFFTNMNYFTWGHLWFLIYLFTFTVIYLPIFVRLMGKESDRQMNSLTVYFLLIPLLVAQLSLRSRWPGWQNLYNDWANFSYYSLYLFIGFMSARIPALESAFHKEWKRAGLLGLAALLPTAGPDLPYFLEIGLNTVACFGLIVFFLGAAKRCLIKTSDTLRYLTEAAFPVYLIHQTVIIIIGYFVIQLSASIAAKYVLLLTSSILVTMLIYHFVVRPINICRFLCGMKPKPSGKRVVGRRLDL